MSGIRAAELIYVLVVIPDGNHAHILIILHQCTDKIKLVVIHILRLVNDQNALCNLSLLHFSVLDQFCGIPHHIVDTLQTADFPQQVKAVGMEGLDFDKICCIADQRHQALFELCRSSAGKCQH